MTMTDKAKYIIDYLDEILKEARCALNYSKDYELVIAVMLSAQVTDNAVNKVSDVLFEKYPTLESLSQASYDDVCSIIKSLGLYKNKAQNVILIAQDILNNFDGKVPSSKKDLMSLRGVGNKTANVVRCELFSLPEFPVDTHINRISKRLNIAKENDDIKTVETKLKKVFPRDHYIKLHHQLIHFGRTICKSLSPKCNECKLQKYCKYYKDNYLK